MSKPATIESTVQLHQNGERSLAETREETLNNINHWNPHVNSFNEIFDQATTEVNEAGRLAGIPIAVKDIICTTEGHTTASSKILKNFTSPYDATVIKRLKDEGATIIGKLNCDEFAMGASNEFSANGPVNNPWDFERVAGGSSGGSVASVASGQVMASLGTDTGGSIRLPASFCGAVGLKPTYSRVSRFGVISYASSFDQVGPITRTVKDNALLLEILAGQDQHDATSSPEKVDNYTQACEQGIAGLKIGIPKEMMGPEVSAEVHAVIETAIKQLETLGAKISEVSLPLMHMAVPTYYLLVKAEASTNLGRFDALRYGPLENTTAEELIDHYLEARGTGFGTEVKRSIIMGTYALSAGYIDAWYKQASRVRTLIRQEFESVFEKVDILAGPVSAETAFRIGEKADDPLAMYLADLLTDPASVAGLPALSVPAGFAKTSESKGQNGEPAELPVGLQLIAPHFQEARLYQAAHPYEQSQDWWLQSPEIPTE